MSALIATNQLRRKYGRGEAAFEALKGLDLKIKKGETVAVVGRSGSGKSTLMHLLALLDSPTSGVVSIDGVDASRLSRREIDRIRNQQFGFVFQQFFLNANDTVLNNVVLPLKIAGMSKRQRNKRGLEVLEAVELKDKVKSRARDLSGGQKQRVVIARALASNPKVIFADEPTGNLDSVTGQKIEDLLFELNETHGITLIIVTHDQELAARCSRRIYLHDGEIEREEMDK